MQRTPPSIEVHMRDGRGALHLPESREPEAWMAEATHSGIEVLTRLAPGR
jgi:hypothetical protein